jgi:hypothetical protein
MSFFQETEPSQAASEPSAMRRYQDDSAFERNGDESITFLDPSDSSDSPVENYPILVV